MPQNEHIERHQKLFGRRLDAEQRERKREARQVHARSEYAQKVRGLRAKILNKERYKEKATAKKTLAIHDEHKNRHVDDGESNKPGAVPAYLLDRETTNPAKVLSNTIKQKRNDKAGKWAVPIPKVAAVSEAEVFKGKRVFIANCIVAFITTS